MVFTEAPFLASLVMLDLDLVSFIVYLLDVSIVSMTDWLFYVFWLFMVALIF